MTVKFSTVSIPYDVIQSWRDVFSDISLSFFCKCVVQNVLNSSDPMLAMQVCMFGNLLK